MHQANKPKVMASNTLARLQENTDTTAPDKIRPCQASRPRRSAAPIRRNPRPSPGGMVEKGNRFNLQQVDQAQKKRRAENRKKPDAVHGWVKPAWLSVANRRCPARVKFSALPVRAAMGMKPSVFRQPSVPRYGMGRENDTCRSILEVLLREINERQASLPQDPDSPLIVSRSRSCPPCYREARAAERNHRLCRLARSALYRAGRFCCCDFSCRNASRNVSQPRPFFPGLQGVVLG